MTNQAFEILAATTANNNLNAADLLALGLGDSEMEIDFILEQLKVVKRV